MLMKFLEDRRNELEGLFFKKLDEELLNNMREKTQKMAQKEALASVLGFEDDAVLEQMVTLGMCRETAIAMCMVSRYQGSLGDLSKEVPKCSCCRINC